jgi:hypothetical protein
MELSQATTKEKKKRIPYPCIHFNHLGDELVSETTMKILAATSNTILLEHNRNSRYREFILLTSHCLPCSAETLHQAPKAQPH